MTTEQWEEFQKNKIKAKHAESLMWNLGFVGTLLRNGVDPQYIIDDLFLRYKTHKEFAQALSDGIEYAEKAYTDGDYKFIDRVLKIPYNHGTD